MEVSGKKYASHGKGESSGSPERLICQPCSAIGEDTEADGFCQNCQEYLCRMCIRYHRKTTLSKHHLILAGDNMPGNAAAQTKKQICTLTCQKHVLEVIKFFCKDHDSVGCGTCMVLEHKSCSVDFIPDVADDFVKGAEYKTLLQRLEQLQSAITISKEDLEKCKKEVAEAYVIAIESIRGFRKDMDTYLDQMERYMVEECDQLNKDNERAMEEIDQDLISLRTELDVTCYHLNSHAKLTGDLFVHAKQTNERLNELQEDMAHKTKHTVKTFKFERDRDLADIVSRKSPLGELVSCTRTLQSLETSNTVDFLLINAGEINVRLSSDKNQTQISGMIVMTDNTVVCVDHKNCNVKVVDTKNRCICSQISLASEPWDITSVSQNEVAITIPNKSMIEFLFLKDKTVSWYRSMEVRPGCHGIAYTNNKLVVSYENGNIEIMTLTEEILQVFKAGNQSDSSRSRPDCVRVGINGDCIFVCDSLRHCVFKMSFEGRLLGTYKDMALVSPRALTVCKDGSVLVCSYRGYSVHLLSPACNKLKILLTGNEAQYAYSVSYSESTSTLFLYNLNVNLFGDPKYDVIQVFKRT